MSTLKIPFRESEMIDPCLIGEQGSGAAVEFNYPVSPKENFRRLFSGDNPLWMPRFKEERNTITLDINPDQAARSPSGGKDMFGIEWTFIPIAQGSMVRPGSPKLSDVNNWETELTFPDIDKWDWQGCRRKNSFYIDSPKPTHIVSLNGLFERLISFMGFSDAAVALLDDDSAEALNSLFARLCGVYESIILKCKQEFDIDIVTFHDDWGTQRAPIFSLDTCKEKLLPFIRRLADYCHTLGVYFELHCCGNVGCFLPLMIDAGVDSWDGQDDANDKISLIGKYGDQIHIIIAPPSFGPGSDYLEMETAGKAFIDSVGGKAIIGRNRGSLQMDRILYRLSRQKFSS